MGKSITPTYRIEMKVSRGVVTPAAWPTKHLGRPTEDTLRQYVQVWEDSTKDGGCNSHLGFTFIREAKVYRQGTGECVAVYRLPQYL